MRILNESRLVLKEPTLEIAQVTVDRLRQIHSTAHEWDAPHIEAQIAGATFQRRMRSQVRRAINEWDLLRLYPDARPETEVTGFHHIYTEDLTLEQETGDELEGSIENLGSSQQEESDEN